MYMYMYNVEPGCECTTACGLYLTPETGTVGGNIKLL